MKNLHRINGILLATTLGLYLTIFLGMLAQILLGAYQLVLAAIVVTKYYPLVSTEIKKAFNKYLLLMLAFGLTVLIFSQFGRLLIQDLLMFLFFAFPLGLAIYQYTLTKRINNYLTQRAFEL